MLDLPARRRRPGLSLTPLIDVVFILLLFFMLATRFDRDAVAPRDAAAEATPDTTRDATPDATPDATLALQGGERRGDIAEARLGVDLIDDRSLRLSVNGEALGETLSPADLADAWTAWASTRLADGAQVQASVRAGANSSAAAVVTTLQQLSNAGIAAVSVVGEAAPSGATDTGPSR